MSHRFPPKNDIPTNQCFFPPGGKKTSAPSNLQHPGRGPSHTAPPTYQTQVEGKKPSTNFPHPRKGDYTYLIDTTNFCACVGKRKNTKPFFFPGGGGKPGLQPIKVEKDDDNRPPAADATGHLPRPNDLQKKEEERGGAGLLPLTRKEPTRSPRRRLQSREKGKKNKVPY